MAINLTSFAVEELHGRRSINIPIRDNKLILVGENGSGKTTVINLIYYFLSRQWEKLSSYNFKSVSATINDEKLTVSRDDLQSYKAVGRYQTRIDRSLPKGLRLEIRDYIRNRGITRKNYEFVAHELAGKYGFSPSTALDLVLSAEIDQKELSFEESPVTLVSTRIGELVNEQILYLPTYRRIEQDLKTIFPNLTIDNEKLHKRLDERQDRSNHLELVEFGMEDVDKNIERKMNELKEFIRSRLNKLTGSYLREVISGEYKSFKTEDLDRISVDAIDSIIKRIGEEILPTKEKKRMRSILGEIQSKQQVTSDHKVIAHFLLKLLEVYVEQQDKEENIRSFIEVCNQYLSATNKWIEFDNTNFKISIMLGTHSATGEDEPNTIQMRQLSSGEKQIVSLFSHLFLSGIEEFFVLIDEPDLSLSVVWQKRLLPDILSITKCTGLIAVTHSPFIFDNEMAPFTRSLNEFWS
jgi:predicted ATP-binding protein involved in virulence